MFSGLIVLLTIFSALSIGVLCGWAALSLVLFAFSRTYRIPEAQPAPAAAEAQTSSV
jgi:hypothetical protein